ncbi:MAG: GGDEF domain-containing protein [Clostridia bacterium]|jgi:diguanylate cyclase (GGDEF)-like protein|nr:GGDEF domain-containing protein [Clostridia bacterium]
MKEFDVIKDKMDIFQLIYDHILIVEPKRKVIVELIDGQIISTDMSCYNCWSDKDPCENCIAMRALQQEETIIEMEYDENKIFLITAVPISIKGQRVVIELIKEVTDELYLKDRKSGTRMKLFSKIDLMNKLATRDELTNLFNRRYIFQQLPKDLLKSSTAKEPLSIILTDLDFFKDINDKYGHIAGDQVLKSFAKELEANIRKDRDWVARYGGEEFIVVLPDTDLELARSIAERIRKKVMDRVLVIDNNKIRITASFGVYTVCDGDKCMTTDGIIEMVDKKLYKAKISGRNTVES